MDYLLSSVEALCYICDSKTTESNEKLISKFTNTTNISFPKMISTLISDEFVLIVGREDVVCDQCTDLVNKMDELQNEILAVRKSLSEFLAKKYQISLNDPYEDLDKENEEFENLQKSTNNLTFSTSSTFNLITNSTKEVLLPGLKNDTVSQKKKIKLECSHCLKKYTNKEYLKHHLKLCECKNSRTSSKVIDKVPISSFEKCDINVISNDGVANENSSEITQNNEGTISSMKVEDMLNEDIDDTSTTYLMCELCNSLLKTIEDYNSHICDQSDKKDRKSIEVISFKDVLAENESTDDKDSNMIEITIENLLDKESKVDNKTDSFDSKVNSICHMCNSVFSSRLDLTRHFLSHYPANVENSVIKKVSCPICGDTFSSLTNCMNHYDIHVKLKGSGVECKEQEVKNNKGSQVDQNEPSQQLTCNTSHSQFSDHSQVHNINPCPVCKKEFPSDLKLKEHLVLHEAKLKLNQCEYCLLRLDTDQDLEHHIDSVHGDIKKTKSCPLCRKQCASSFSVKRHVMKNHLIPVLQQEIREKYSHGSDLVDDMKSLGASKKAIERITNINRNNVLENPNLKMIVNIEASDVNFCLLCGFSSKSAINLNKHREKHSAKKIPCSRCEHLSCDLDDLAQHLSETHELVLTENFCPHCLCEPDEDICLHMKALHGKFYSHLTCYVCKDMFFSKENLKYHFSVTHLIFTEQQSDEKEDDLEIDDNSVENEEPVEHSAELSISEDLMTDELTAALKNITQDSADGSLTPGLDEKVTYNCGVCEQQMGSKDEIQEHLLCHGHICFICRKDCKSKTGLDRHVTKHSVNSQNIDCPLCSMMLHDSLHLRLHMHTEHPACTQNFCFTCKKYHLSSKCSRWTCEICSEHFANVLAFIHHRTYGHREDFRCVHCKKMCKNLRHLKYHEKMHVKYKGKVFKCSECNKTFQTPSSLKSHTISHTGNYQFVCEFCGRGFVSSYGLGEHRASHTGDIRYCCEICGKSFRLYDTYHRHRRQHDNPFPAQCTECGKRFRNSSRVAEHKRKVHTGERPYACPYCPKTFNVTSSYHIHLCRHTQVFPYNCDTCKRGFTTRIKYTNHLVSKHNEFSLIKPPKMEPSVD